MAVILVVDDEAANRELLRVVLTSDGHDVRLASNGEEALRLLDAVAPDLVVVDLFMPVLGGAEFVRAIRKDPRYEKLRVALYTGTAVDAMMADFMHANSIEWIVPKPAEPDAILEAARAALA